MLKLSRKSWKNADGLTPAQRYRKQAAEIKRLLASGYTMTFQGDILRFSSGRGG